MKTLIYIGFAIVFAAAVVACGQSQTQTLSLSERVDKYFADNPDRFMGSIEIQENGKTVYEKSLGFADIENKIPAKADTKFRIGSITKTFMAVMTLKAAKEGKLSLDDKLAKYFPDAHITNAESITIDQLLYHRSGLHDVVNDDFADFITYYTKPQTRAQMMERIAKAGANFTPDSTFRYCNTGYILLTYILEDVYGKNYGELLNEQIINPLQLSNTGVCSSPINSKQNFARSYTIAGELQDEFDPTAVLGAGAMYSTPKDLLKFINALTSGYFGSDIFDQMRMMKDRYGRGLFEWKLDGIQGVGHSGGIHGFAAVMFNFGEITLAFCTNSSFADADNLARTIFGLELEKHDYITLSKEQLAKLEGKYHNEQLKIDIEISSTGEQLMAQASGQPAFPLDAITETEFEFKAAGVKMVFHPKDNTFTLYQNGGEFIFTKTGDVEKPQYQAVDADQLAKYAGVYHSDALKMDLTVTVDGNQLKGQGTGQPSFPLSAVSDDTFEFKAADIKIHFDVANGKMTLRQRGMDFELVKK